MPKMKLTHPDGTSEIVEDETWKNKGRIIPKFNKYQPRNQTLEVILEALRLRDGQTLDQLSISTNIPTYFLGKYLVELEKEKRIARSGPRHFLPNVPPSPTELII